MLFPTFNALYLHQYLPQYVCSASVAVLCSSLISCFDGMLLSDTDILVTLGAFLLPVFSYFFPGCRRGVRQSCVVVSEGLQSTADCNWALGLAVNENSPFHIETRRMWSDIEDHHLDFFRPQVEGCSAPGLKAIDYILSQGPSWRHPLLSRDAVLRQPAICDFAKDLASKSCWCLFCGAVQGLEPR